MCMARRLVLSPAFAVAYTFNLPFNLIPDAAGITGLIEASICTEPSNKSEMLSRTTDMSRCPNITFLTSILLGCLPA